ncbi:MAG: DNA-directed RNA polymerase subunit omega [Blastocatellia bacterium]
MKTAISDNKYLKALIAIQRTKQIWKGARPLVQSSGMRATRIALEEVERGLIGFDFTHHDLDLGGERDNRADGG